jgi:LysR family transcriptional regulator, nitrogen assimilation regulatory protein
MDLKHIVAFIATFEEGSINRAANRLGSPQPTLSVLVRDLEAELKTVLFERLASGAEPTDAARTLYPHFQRVLADIDTARMSISGSLTDIAGPLKVGLGPAIVRGLLPDVLEYYLNRYPRVEVRISEGFSGHLTEWALSGELDCAVVALPPKDRRVIGRRLSLEPIVMISGPSSGRKPFAPADLSTETGLKVVMPWSRLSVREVLDAFVQSGQIPAARTVEIDSIPGILDFVTASDWVTFLPLTSISRDLADRKFVIQPLSDPIITSEFYLIHPARRSLSAAAIAFIDRLEMAFRDSAVRWEKCIERSRQPAVIRQLPSPISR